MNNSCPECGAVYAVAEKDIGRRIACKKCNTALIVAEEGLVRDDATTPPPRRDDALDRPRSRDDDEDRPRRRRPRDDDDDMDDDRPRRPKGPGMGAYIEKLKGVKVGGDVSTWLFGIGLFLVIYSYFSPQIDAAKVSARNADVTEAELNDRSDQRDTDNRNDGKPSEDDRKARDKRRKEYEKEKPVLDDKVKYAEASANHSKWWTAMFRLVGFAVLAFGSIGYMQSETTFRRILGGGTILLIMLQVIGGAAGVSVQMGGRG
jgi:predicted Zn finger-like uncharacterized protein